MGSPVYNLNISQRLTISQSSFSPCAETVSYLDISCGLEPCLVSALVKIGDLPECSWVWCYCVWWMIRHSLVCFQEACSWLSRPDKLPHDVQLPMLQQGCQETSSALPPKYISLYPISWTFCSLVSEQVMLVVLMNDLLLAMLIFQDLAPVFEITDYGTVLSLFRHRQKSMEKST